MNQHEIGLIANDIELYRLQNVKKNLKADLNVRVK